MFAQTNLSKQLILPFRQALVITELASVGEAKYVVDTLLLLLHHATPPATPAQHAQHNNNNDNNTATSIPEHMLIDFIESASLHQFTFAQACMLNGQTSPVQTAAAVQGADALLQLLKNHGIHAEGNDPLAHFGFTKTGGPEFNIPFVENRFQFANLLLSLADRPSWSDDDRGKAMAALDTLRKSKDICIARPMQNVPWQEGHSRRTRHNHMDGTLVPSC